MTGGAVHERYRTLAAMLALGEFSVAEIADLAQVGKSTVRTVLRREDDYRRESGSAAYRPPGRAASSMAAAARST